MSAGLTDDLAPEARGKHQSHAEVHLCVAELRWALTHKIYARA